MSESEILVVEDDAGVRQFMSVALRQYSFNARLAGSGAEAVELYRRYHDAIDLVLLDVQMSPLDGPQTLSALREIDPQFRAVFMSGHTGRYTTQELMGLGAACVIQKPFAGLAQVMEDLRNLVGPARP